MWDTFYPNLQFLEKFSSQYTFGWVGELLLNLEEKFFDSSIIWNELELITYFFRVIICYRNGVSEYEKKT